jgi:hypothetical protein
LTYLEGRRVAELSISAVNIDRAENIPATASNAGEAPVKSEVKTPAIDLTVRNAGSVSGLVSEVQLTVEYAELLPGCWGGGGLNYTASYPIQIPQDDRPTPYTVNERIPFEVEGGRHDRFGVVLGPRGDMNEGSGPWLYVLQVDLIDEYGKTLSGGERIAVMAPDLHENLMDAAENVNWWSRPCLEDSLRVLDAAPLSEARVAPELQQYHQALRSVAGSD